MPRPKGSKVIKCVCGGRVVCIPGKKTTCMYCEKTHKVAKKDK